jgi:formylglycine-generating enzyme required for sulfatase activity
MMNKKHTTCRLLAGAATLLLMGDAFAAEEVNVVVLPIGGAVGNATAADVAKDKTFSSRKAGRGVKGTLELPPNAQTFTNSNGMRFNLLPTGSFTMGSPESEPGRGSDETEHQVTLTKPVYMQVTEVTNAQWNTVIVDPLFGVNPSASHTGNNYPVETASWYDAVFFANRLSIDEGRSACYGFSGVSGTPGSGGLIIGTVTMNTSCTGYRLPTEAEWEYAVRATTTTAWAYLHSYDTTATGQETGSGFNSNLHAMGWYFYNNAMENSSAVPAYETGTKPVARKQANKWGLLDMHGNVWEWCQDWYAAYVGDATDPTGPADGSLRVIRGSSYTNGARNARSAERGVNGPVDRGSDLGFRLVLPPGQ